MWWLGHPCLGLFQLPVLWLGAVFVTTLFPLATAPPDAALEVVGERRRGTTFLELPCKSIINSPESTGMEFWSVNPYVGCEFGCSYCYARFAHHYVVERARESGTLSQPLGPEPFEQRIFVKQRGAVLAALDSDLSRMRRRIARDGAQTLVIGSGTDPYQPAEREYRITRTVLERLRAERGFKVGIITKSPLVCRDVDVLAVIGRRNLTSVYISVISTDVRVIKRFEARSPMPHARFRAVRKLVDAGVRAGLLVAPVLPGITDTVPQIEALMQAARDAGAHFVHPVPLRMYAETRKRVLPILEQTDARLAERYVANYGSGQHATDEYVAAMRARFREIGERYGIPDTGGEPDHPSANAQPEQLQLWDES